MLKAAGVQLFNVTMGNPYANPHVVRLGSVGGRGGPESLPGATFRNIWVSAAARPNFPNDNP